MAFPFDPARLTVGIAVRRAAHHAAQGAYVCSLHGPLPSGCGRKCPQCGPPWIRYVRRDPTATLPAEPLRPAPVLDSRPRTGLDSAQMARALAALNEADRRAYARYLGCGVGVGTERSADIRPEDYPGCWVCLTCNEPATDRCHDKRHAVVRHPCPSANDPVGPLPEARRPFFGRQRDARGRYTCEAREPVPEDERMSGEPLRAALRARWFHLPKGSRKPFARHVRVPFNTMHRYAKGCIELPAACQRRISKALRMIERGELRLTELYPGIPQRQLWAANRSSHAWRRHEPTTASARGNPA
jgi:hypothetical protein